VLALAWAPVLVTTWVRPKGQQLVPQRVMQTGLPLVPQSVPATGMQWVKLLVHP
jgi:hypothetical protein